MKILYYLYESESHMSSWQDYNFINELAAYEVEFVKVRVSNKLSEEQALVELQSQIHEYRPDLFMSSCDDNHLNESLLGVVAENGLPSLLICFDNLSVPYKHKKCCKYFDLVWITSKETEYLFKRWGAKTLFQPYAANPFVYRPHSGTEINSLCFIGSCYGVRKEKIDYLISNNIDINLYGGNYDININTPFTNSLMSLRDSLSSMVSLSKFSIGRHCLKAALLKSFFRREKPLSDDFQDLIAQSNSLTFDDMSQYYSRHSLALCVTELWNTYLLRRPIHKLHLRTFEVPMSGGLQISSRHDELSNYYKEDVEAIYYSSIEEMIDKCRFYLNDENAQVRHKMKAAARARSLSDHTWKHRFDNVFKELNL